MKLVTAEEVLKRDAETVNKVTALIQEWYPKLSASISYEVDDAIELVIMPSPFILDEFERPVQFSVFYDEDSGAVTQLQFTGMWLVGGISITEDGEEIVTPFDHGHPLFERSIAEALGAMLLEAKHSANNLEYEARDAVREQFYKEAHQIVADILGDAPAGWVSALDDGAEVLPKKMLN